MFSTFSLPLQRELSRAWNWGPWFLWIKWHNSWIITKSASSGVSRIRWMLRLIFPDFEQLPQFVRLFLTVTLPGLKPYLVASSSTRCGRYFLASERIIFKIASSDIIPSVEALLSLSYGISPVINLRGWSGAIRTASYFLFLLCFRSVAAIHSSFSSTKAIALE